MSGVKTFSIVRKFIFNTDHKDKQIFIPDFKPGDNKIIIGPFWHEVFTESYEYPEEDIATTTSEPLPFFEDDPSTNNVTAQLGSRVHLHCRVHDLGEKTVSNYY